MFHTWVEAFNSLIDHWEKCPIRIERDSKHKRSNNLKIFTRKMTQKMIPQSKISNYLLLVSENHSSNHALPWLDGDHRKNLNATELSSNHLKSLCAVFFVHSEIILSDIKQNPILQAIFPQIKYSHKNNPHLLQLLQSGGTQASTNLSEQVRSSAIQRIQPQNTANPRIRADNSRWIPLIYQCTRVAEKAHSLHR